MSKQPSSCSAPETTEAGSIGLLGHSEGGMVAPYVANRSDIVAFVVLLASPAVPGNELLRTQQLDLLRLAWCFPPLTMHERVQMS
ncbi:hypothetical protein [Candidatus Poriferisodalis sp.]|uniref:hypothetical protein n=1 Tax=Candidatus Poriferisodalis sp. TaxID=3101277 RepID=UPI003C6F713C